MEVSVTCTCTTDPKTVNITVGPLPTGGYYTFQVPSSYYDMISGPLNYPSNPCAECPPNG